MKTSHISTLYFLELSNKCYVPIPSKIFDRIQADQKWYDPKEYDMPKEITLQLTHKDDAPKDEKEYAIPLIDLTMKRKS